MTIKEEILKGSGLIKEDQLNEMAAKELATVVDLIKKGDIEGAVAKYTEAGGNPSGVTRTVNTFLTKNPKIDRTNFDKFSKYFSEKKKTEGANTPTRKYTKSKTGVTKSGEAIEAGGQSAEARNKRLSGRIQTEVEFIKKEMNIIKNGTVAQQQEVAKEIIKSLSAEDLDDEDKEELDELKKFVEDGKNRKLAIAIMKETIEKGAVNIATLGDVSANFRRIKPKEENIPQLEKVYKKIEMARKKKETEEA